MEQESKNQTENIANDNEKLLLFDVINQERSCATCIWCDSAKMCKTCDKNWSEYERSC